MPKIKSNSVLTVAIDVAARTLTYDVIGAGTKVLHTDRASVANRAYAMLHGFKQRVGDSAALPFNKELQRYATPQEKFEAVSAMIEHYESGAESWNTKVARQVDSGLLFEAMSRAYPEKGADRIREWLKGFDIGQRKALLQSDAIKPHADAILAEATKDVDTEAMFSTL